jgi:hypothetical protein
MKINLQLTYENGQSKEITANAADMVAFEEKFNVSVAELSAAPRMSHLYYLCWHSEKRTGGTTESFEKWLESVDQVGAGESDPKSKG